MACISSEPHDIPLLDRYDPPSPITITNEYDRGEFQDRLLAGDFLRLDLNDIYSDDEDVEAHSIITFDSGQTFRKPEGRTPCLHSTPSPYSCSNLANMNDASIVSTPIEDSPGIAFEDSTLSPFFFRDHIRYYSDLRSLYPVCSHIKFFNQHFRLFRDMQFTLFDARLALRSNAVCLEVGCGAGFWAKAFARANSRITVFGVDSTCFGPRTDSDPPNYQFHVSDLINTHNLIPFELTATTTDGRFDYIRCTRLNGRICSWSDWCRKMYLYAKEGSSIEIYEILPDSTIQNENQPLWGNVQSLQESCARMEHRPHLPAREWAESSQIEEYLRAAGFTRIQTIWREIKLDAQDPSSLHHIQSLASQATYLAHLIGMPYEGMYNLLLWEATQYGLKVRSLTICAQKFGSA